MALVPVIGTIEQVYLSIPIALKQYTYYLLAKSVFTI